MKRNPNLGPSQMRARKRRLFWARFYIILFFLAVIILGLAILSGHERVRVKDVVISGQASVSTDRILEIVNSDLVGRYWYLFARSNSLIFPRFQIKRDLLTELQVIKSVDISWEDWQKISVSIEERKPHSVWCKDEAECYLVDKTGLIYGLAPSFSGNLFIKDYGRISTSTEIIGQYFLPTETYSQIFKLVNLLYKKNIRVISVVADDFDYKFTLESGPIIIFNNKNDFAYSFGNLFSALETGDLDLIKDAEIIKYIDLRFDNKIVIGKKGE